MAESLDLHAGSPNSAVIARGLVGPGCFARIFTGSAGAAGGIEITAEGRLACRILVTAEALPELAYFASQVCDVLSTELLTHEGEAQVGLGRICLPNQAGQVVAWATLEERVPQFVMQLGCWQGRSWRPAAVDVSTCSIFLPLDDVPAFAAVVAEAMEAITASQSMRELKSGPAAWSA